jgi:hypothetical protein
MPAWPVRTWALALAWIGRLAVATLAGSAARPSPASALKPGQPRLRASVPVPADAGGNNIRTPTMLQ